ARDDQAFRLEPLAVFIGRLKDSGGRPPDASDARVVFDLQLKRLGEVAEITHKIVGVGKVSLSVTREEQSRIFREERIPIHSKVHLRIVPAGVRLVVRYETAVAWKRAENHSGRGPRLEDLVVASCPCEKVSELQAGWTRSNDQVIPHFSSATFRIFPLVHTCSLDNAFAVRATLQKLRTRYSPW